MNAPRDMGVETGGCPHMAIREDAFCCWCQRYEEQLRYIHKTAGQFPEHADEALNVPLPPEAKERIKQRLAENIR
jgi:hypothetical protein